MVKIVAELSINHLGMRKIAAVMIRRLAQMGVDYIKLKKKDVEKYYSPGKTYKDYDFITYRKSLELGQEDFEYLDALCKEVGVGWFSTVHDPESLAFVAQFEPPFYKIASMDARDFEFVQWLVGANKDKTPIIISAGGQNLDYIKKVAEYVTNCDVPLLVNHCVAIYPTAIEQCNVYRLLELRRLLEPLGCEVGYSGHEVGWMPTLMAVQLGAKKVERHVTLSRDLHIHHIGASLTLDEFAKMVSDIRDLEIISKQSVDTHLDELNFLEARNYT